MSASSERERLPQRQLGELMTELGLISEEQLATVLEVQQQSKRPLGQIIVELGFASGAALARCCAARCKGSGALKTEYGFALGVPPKDEDVDVAAGPNGSLPKLRLAPTAVAPPLRPSLEPVEGAIDVEEPAPVAALPAEPEPVDAVAAEEIETDAPVEAIEVEEIADSSPDEVLDGIETIPETPLTEAIDPLELELATVKIRPSQARFAEHRAAAVPRARAAARPGAASQLCCRWSPSRSKHEHRLIQVQERRGQGPHPEASRASSRRQLRGKRRPLAQAGATRLQDRRA